MLNLSWGPAQKILCLGAHPDDIEIGCGGTLLRLLAEDPRRSIAWVVFSGEKRRREEAETSAAGLLRGASHYELQFAEFRDGFFPYEAYAVKEVLLDVRRRFSPDLIFTHRTRDAHQDHRLLGELTWQAFRNHLILEYEIPKYDADLGGANLYVQIDESTATQKIHHLMKAFPSQHDKPWFVETTFWSLLRIRGVEAKSQSGLAEAYYAPKLVI